MRQLLHLLFWVLFLVIESFVYYSQSAWGLTTMGKAMAYDGIAILPRMLAAYLFIGYFVPRWRENRQQTGRSVVELVLFLAAALLLYRSTINWVVWPVVHQHFPVFNPLDARLSAYSFIKLITPIALLYCVDAICFARRRSPHTAEKILINGKDYSFFKVNKKKVKVHFADILFVESNKEYVRIVLTDGQDILTKVKISELEALWSPYFERIHRSFIVPLHQISSYTAVQVQLAEKVVPIGRTYQKKILEKLARLD